MKQLFVHLKKYYISDLITEIQNEIDAHNEEGYILFNIQYSGLEGNDGNCHAYLLFNQV